MRTCHGFRQVFGWPAARQAASGGDPASSAFDIIHACADEAAAICGNRIQLNPLCEHENPKPRLTPIHRGAEDDGLMPTLCGVGFTDVGLGQPGTDSAQFKGSDFQRWRQVRMLSGQHISTLP